MSTTEKVMVTAPAAPTIVATAPNLPDLQLVPLSKMRQILIRTIRTYLQALVGFLIAAGTGATEAVGITLPPGDFLTLLLQALGLALAPAVIAFIQNLIELLSDLDDPKTRA